MTTGAREPNTTVGKTIFYQGGKQDPPAILHCLWDPLPGCRDQASELMGYVRDMTIDGLMDNKPQLLWASHYLSALAKALMDDAEWGMMR